jgi:hypothetical protein
MSLERRCLLIEWDKLIEIAENSRGQGIYYRRESDLTIKAATSRYASEIQCANEKEFNEKIKKLEDLGFVEVFETIDLSAWITK